MKSIVIIGKAGAGKSTTIREICKRLDPQKVWKLKFNENDFNSSKLEEATVGQICNNTYIIQVKGKNILVAAGASTEQNIRIKVLIEICKEIEVEIDFAIVARRSFERKYGFNTINELERFGAVILKEEIHKRPGKDFFESQEWNDRIDKIKKIVLENL